MSRKEVGVEKTYLQSQCSDNSDGNTDTREGEKLGTCLCYCLEQLTKRSQYTLIGPQMGPVFA